MAKVTGVELRARASERNAADARRRLEATIVTAEDFEKFWAEAVVPMVEHSVKRMREFLGYTSIGDTAPTAHAAMYEWVYGESAMIKTRIMERAEAAEIIDPKEEEFDNYGDRIGW